MQEPRSPGFLFLGIAPVVVFTSAFFMLAASPRPAFAEMDGVVTAITSTIDGNADPAVVAAVNVNRASMAEKAVKRVGDVAKPPFNPADLIGLTTLTSLASTIAYATSGYAGLALSLVAGFGPQLMNGLDSMMDAFGGFSVSGMVQPDLPTPPIPPPLASFVMPSGHLVAGYEKNCPIVAQNDAQPVAMAQEPTARLLATPIVSVGTILTVASIAQRICGSANPLVPCMLSHFMPQEITSAFMGEPPGPIRDVKIPSVTVEDKK